MYFQSVDLPEEGFLLYEFKHSDGELVREHYHRIYEILYALEGVGTMTLEGRTTAFSQDSAAVITPGSAHSITSGSNLTVLVLAFDESIFDLPFRGELLHRVFGRSQVFQPGSFDVNGLRRLLRRALFEQSSGDALRPLAIKIVLSEMLVVLARSGNKQPISDANTLRAERIRQYLDTHYFEIQDAGHISSKIGISSRYLNAIFKERFQVTPMQYLTDLRIEMAKKMLAETDKEIASICFELGFETLSTFYRIFKSAVRIPPNKYRSLHAIRAL